MLKSRVSGNGDEESSWRNFDRIKVVIPLKTTIMYILVYIYVASASTYTSQGPGKLKVWVIT